MFILVSRGQTAYFSFGVGAENFSFGVGAEIRVWRTTVFSAQNMQR